MERLELRALLSATGFDSMPALVADLSPVDSGVHTTTSGSLVSTEQVDVYTFTVSEQLGIGRLIAGVSTSSGDLHPRLTLAGPNGTLLVQSDSGRITQHLEQGSYSLSVSAQAGLGSYRMTTEFSSASRPLAPLVAGKGARSVELSDLNRDGILDVAATNFTDNSVSVFLGIGDGTFQPAIVFETGPGPISVTIADVNGDGHPDLLTANKYNNSVSLLIGNGDGSFQEEAGFPVGTRPSGVAAADINGDGIPDLIASNYTDSTVSVLLGNPDATFQDQQVFATGLGPGRLRIADLNGDGVPDVVTPNYYSSTVSVLLGREDGSLEDQQSFATDGGPYSIAVGDINGDGHPDVATSNYIARTVSVLLGKGDGTLAPQRPFATAQAPYALAMADINGDGRPDIATVSFVDNSANVLLGQGDGTLGEPLRVPAGRGAGVIALGDMDGDGRPEIVTANFFEDTVSVLPGRGDGTFSTPSVAPLTTANLRPYGAATADLNGDGLTDIVTATKGDNSVSVLLGNSDGSFRTKQSFPAGLNPNGLAVADVSGDGIPDVVTANYTDNTASVLLGRGDGTFNPPQHLPVGAKPYSVTIADVTGDGVPDIILPNSGDSTLSILAGRGDGTFLDHQILAIETGTESNRNVTSVTVADFNADGNLDLAVGNFNSTSVPVLLSNGDGTFQPQQTLDVGSLPVWSIAGDVNGDNSKDLIVANLGDGTISVLLNRGDGSFLPQQAFPAGEAISLLTTGDFDGDGILDVATGNLRTHVGHLLLGNGDGTFQAPRTFPVNTSITGLEAVDLDDDGRLDLITYDHTGNSISEIFGNGDGTFRLGPTLELSKNRFAVWVADVNGDGKADIVKTNLLQNEISIELGNGTGTFEPGVARDVGVRPTAITATDLNGDGRTDLIAANSDDDSLSVLLGNGDGTFNIARAFSAGRSPRAVATADVNGDGIPDLLAANYNDDTASVLLGLGDGSFAAQRTVPVGPRPYALAVADINGDGILDLLATSATENTVAVLLGTGHGSFQPHQAFFVGRQPLSLAVMDVNGDGRLDAVTGNAADGTVSVLLGNGNGTFLGQLVLAVGPTPFSIAAADVDGDGRVDLITTSFDDNSVSILSGNGDGTFQLPQFVSVGSSPVQVVAADVNNDGRPDLVTVGNRDESTGAILSVGDGAFQFATTATEVGLRNTPLRADLDDDGILDSIVLDRSGNILFRKRLAITGNSLAPPVILNTGYPARDIAVLRSGSGVAIAAADARFDPALSVDEFVFPLSSYTIDASGEVKRHVAASTTELPARLVAADLTGNGLDDLIAANPLDDTVTIAIQTSTGRFSTPLTLMTGIVPSDIFVADVNQDGLPDVLVSSQASGDVTVLLNDASHRFIASLRFRASTQPYAVDDSSGNLAVSSFAQSVSLAAGDFTDDGHEDVVVVNRGAHSFTVLEGNGRGGFENPRLELTTSTSDGFAVNHRPGAAKAGDFNGDGRLDLAVLMEDTGQAWIYTGIGNGTFNHTFTIPAGDLATGLSIVPSLTSNFLDLLIGNGFGDVLHLEGKGDGTFQIQGRRVSLSVVPDLFGPGQAGVLVGNQEDNRVTVQTQMPGGTEFAAIETLDEAASSGRLAPGDVRWALLAEDSSLPDAIVVSTGSNAVIVYHTTAITNGVPVFAPKPHMYFVGTAPASVTLADINDDGVPDMLVANRGSNDVSVLFGAYDSDGSWRGVPGPRLRSGGAGPIAVTVREMNGDDIGDLVILNGQSGTFTLVPGVGQGFFDDRNPRTLLSLGHAIVEPPSFAGDSGIGFAVTIGGLLTKFDLSKPDNGASVVFSAEQVLAARAITSDQVVVALADGSVKVLEPDGDLFVVTSVLETRSGARSLPSSLVVLPTGTGQFQVLVSSQGSDAVSVFGAAKQIRPPLSIFVPVAATSSNTSSSGAGLAASSVASSTTATRGLSLSSFSAFNGSRGTNWSVAGLVSVEGNSYSAVPLLDFGSLRDNEDGDGRTRMPWLSMLHRIGDTSSLTRFITGLDELIADYLRDAEELERADASEDLEYDPWDEDLFFPPLLDLPSVEDVDSDEKVEKDETANIDPEKERQRQAEPQASAETPTDTSHQMPERAGDYAAVTDLLMTTDIDWEPQAEPAPNSRSPEVAADLAQPQQE